MPNTIWYLVQSSSQSKGEQNKNIKQQQKKKTKQNIRTKGAKNGNVCE